MEVLDSYILGKITLEEMEVRIDRFEYSMDEEQAGEQYKIAKADYEAFREKYLIMKD